MTTTIGAPPPNTWRLALSVFVLLLASLCAVYFETARAIVTIWYRSDTFAHGFIVPPIVLWLVWRQRQTLRQITPAPSFTAWLLVAGAAFGWLLGDLATVNALMQLTFVSLVILLVPAVLGWRVARAIAFPLAFLFFAVPFGEFAMPQLMEWTADFTVRALRFTGIPVYREGLQFVIPSGNWSVVEACSGVRYLIASLTVGTLFAYLNYQTTSRRVLFIAVSFVVPIVANWMRAYIIVMLGHLSGNKLAAGVDHLIYGWVFFGIVIMLMFLVGARWSEPEPAPALPGSIANASGLWVSPAKWMFAVVSVLTVLAAPMAARWAINDSAHARATPVLAAPAQFSGGWTSATQLVVVWQPAFNNPSAHFQADYVRDDKSVGLYLGYYHRQNSESKLVGSENALVKSKDPQWVHVSGGSRSIEANGKPVAVRTAELRGAPLAGQASENRLVVWQIYWVNGTLTASDIKAKALTAVYSLLGRGDDSAVIIVYAPKGEGGQGEATLSEFMRDNLTPIQMLLEKANPTP